MAIRIEMMVVLFVLTSLHSSCNAPSTSPGTQAETSASTTGSCAPVDLPEPSSVSGQLTFTLDSSIDPCSVAGYVVGYQDDLKVKTARDGTYFISNIPAGDHDVIVIASLSSSTLKLDARKDKAVRFGKQTFLAGVRKEKGKIELPDAGAISGKVTLAGRADHAGIHVYIPGTGFDATTDTDGSYTIAPFVPSGINNLYFEKDGYHRGQIEEIDVQPGVSSNAADMELVLSTGAEGFLVMSGGEAYSNSRTVSLTIGATNDAVLMKVSEDNAFTNKSWLPLKTYTFYTFDSDGEKSLYVKFADANGLESSPFSTSIVIDTVSPTFSVTSTFDCRQERTKFTINASDLNPLTMKIEPASEFDSAIWKVFSSSVTLPYSANMKIQIKDIIGNKSDVAIISVSRTATISQARGDIASVTIGSNSIFAGGNTTSGASSVVDIYNSSTNKWLTANLSQARWGISATSAGANAIFAGGQTLAGFSDVVDLFDSSLNIWSTTSLMQPRMGLVATTVGTKAFFAGGFVNSDLTASNVIDTYDSITNTWSTLALSQARGGMASTTIGTKIFFAGGSYRSNDQLILSNVVDIYDSVANTWSIATLSQARMSLAATTVGTKAIFAGGYYGGSNFSNVVDIYDSSTNSWSTGALSQASSDLTATTVGTKAIFAGGVVAGGGITNVVEIYNSSTSTWSTSSLSQARQKPAATTVGTKAIFAGGYGTSARSDAIDIYDSSKDMWSTDL